MFGNTLNTLFRLALFPKTFNWKNKLNYLSKTICKNQMKLLSPHCKRIIGKLSKIDQNWNLAGKKKSTLRNQKDWKLEVSSIWVP